MKKTLFFFFFINKATTMSSQKYIPVHMRNKSSSFQTNSTSNFDEDFPDLLGSNSNVDTLASQEYNSIATYNDISTKNLETKNVNQIPEGWQKLTLDMTARNIPEEPIWEQRKMQEKYEQGLEFMQYIQEKNDEFIDSFIHQYGINEYMRLYKCDFSYDSDEEPEEIDELSDLESEEDY